MHILIMRNNSNQQAIEASLLLSAFFSSQGIEHTLMDSSRLINDILREEAAATLPDSIDMAIVLGGDGTILHTAHLLHGRNIPILGFRYGRLGFLANEVDEGIIALVSEVLAGEVLEEQRSFLSVQVVCEGDEDPYGNTLEQAPAVSDVDPIHTYAPFPYGDPNNNAEDELLDTFGVISGGLNGKRVFSALNEVVVSRGAMGRIIDFDVTISGSHIANMRGDGIIVASATGSTAYALSAGGPLVSPNYAGLIVVPLAPHTLHSRSIITADNDVVEITLSPEESFREATLFIDGEILAFDQPIRRVYVKRAGSVTLLRTRGDVFFERVAKTFF